MSELNWHSRRIKLQQQINEAETAVSEAALAVELGTAAEGDILTHQARVAELQARLKGVDLARERTVTEEKHRAARADQTRRKATLQEVDKLLASRLRHAKRVSKAAKELAAAWADHQADCTAIVTAALPFARDLGDRGIVELRNLLGEGGPGAFHSVKPLIGGELVDGGLTLSSSDFTPVNFRHRENHLYGVAAFVAGKNATVRAQLEPIASSDDGEAG